MFTCLRVLWKNNFNGKSPIVLSVIIPTLNAARHLPATIKALVDPGLPIEVLVVDGGSADRTPNIAKALGGRVFEVPPGRGGQLSAGASKAKGEWLIFLHADTVLAPGWSETIKKFMASPGSATKAGYFAFKLDDEQPGARRLEKIVAWRSRIFGLPYGDQGLLIRREYYHQLGGYRPLPLMEDVEFIRQIGRRNLVALGADAVTSADRYQKDGYPLRMARNGFCLALYFLGVPPRFIAKVYA